MESQERKVAATKPLRERMPEVSAFVDELRKVFGADLVDGRIRAGMRGEPVFWARENGHEIGTRRTGRFVGITADPVTGIAVATEREP